MAAKISKIVISIGGDEKTLSLDEARELRNALNDLLGSPDTSRIIERIIEHQPLWPLRPFRPYWTMTASGNTTHLALQSEHAGNG